MRSINCKDLYFGGCSCHRDVVGKDESSDAQDSYRKDRLDGRQRGFHYLGARVVLSGVPIYSSYPKCGVYLVLYYSS